MIKRIIPAQLVVALLELGQAEIPGATANQRIVEYLKSAGVDGADGDEIPWCSAFVNWCYIQAGLKGVGSYGLKFPGLARTWLGWGIPVITPQLGDVAVFRRGTTTWQGHVGHYLYRSAGQVSVLGGNQGDMVSIAKYSESDVLGFRRFKLK